MDMKPDTTCVLANHGTVLQCVINARDTIISFHGEEKTTRKLLTRRTCIEIGRCSMDKQFLAQKVIGLKGSLQAVLHRPP